MKPTRFWGSSHVTALAARVCDRRTCSQLQPGTQRHRVQQGGTGRVVKELAYRIPANMVEYVLGLPPKHRRSDVTDSSSPSDFDEPPDDDSVDKVWDDEVEDLVRKVRYMQLNAEPDSVRTADEEEEVFRCVAEHIAEAQRSTQGIKGAVEARQPDDSPEVCRYRKLLMDEFSDSSLSGVYPRHPPVRGPFGEAKIWLKPDVRPVSVLAHTALIDAAIAEGKMEPGEDTWNTPSFPVPKKRPGEYRLVQDFRPPNLATEKMVTPCPSLDISCRGRVSSRCGQCSILLMGIIRCPSRRNTATSPARPPLGVQCNGLCR